MNQRRGVAANGDSEDIGTWSGTPHYLLHAGRQSGFLDSGLDLRVATFRTRRFAWQAGQILRGRRTRGFQYSGTFLDLLGRKAVDECRRLELEEVVSHYQLLPARYLLEHSIRTTYYLDTTLTALFATHGMFAWLNETVSEDAIQRERAEYHAVRRVVTMAGWVRESLRQTYGLPVDRIHTVLPGANLPEEEVRRRLRDRRSYIAPDRFTAERPLRLGFIGKDWKRKGLPRLVAAAELLHRTGIAAEVVVIGKLPPEFRNHCRVRPVGSIDKSRELSRFLDTIDSCDLGCAPSHEEPMGIAPLEYLRLGIPVLCTATGGLTDVCEAAGPAAILVGKDATPEELAAHLEVIARNPDRRQRMRLAAWERKEYFTWDRAVRELQSIWSARS